MLTKRPTGKRAMLAGTILLLVGVVALLAHGTVNGFWLNDQYPIEHWSQYVAIWAPALFSTCIPLGAVAWLTGYVVFAVSFLPSRDDMFVPD